MKNLIDEYVEIVSGYTDSPREFVEATGYYIVSTLLGRFCRTPYARGMAKPNVWFLISSMPGLMRRSTVIGWANYVYKRALTRYFNEELGMDKYEAKLKVMYSLIEEGTPEGIADNIQDSGLDTYNIVSGEFGTIMMKMGSKHYTHGVSTLLSKLYYGEGGVVYLSKRSGKTGARIIPSGLYVCMLTGMQEPNLYITPSMVRQGIVRRIMIIYIVPEQLKEYKPPLSIGMDNIYGELDEYADRMFEHMVKFRENAGEVAPFEIPIIFKKSAVDKINEFDRKNTLELKKEATLLACYRVGFWEHLSKLSMLRAIGELRFKRRLDQYVIDVEVSDYKMAKEFLRRALYNTEEVFTTLGEERIPVRTAEAPLERVYTIIRRAGEVGITRQELNRKSKMTAAQLDEYIYSLKVQDRIEIKIEPTKYKETIRYFAKV